MFSDERETLLALGSQESCSGHKISPDPIGSSCKRYLFRTYWLILFFIFIEIIL
jgi:hypothetical protein